jgi:hypothetical protein
MCSDEMRVDADGMSTDLFAREACAFIRQNRDRPFFAMVAFNAVHNKCYQLPADWLRRRGIQGMNDWNPAAKPYITCVVPAGDRRSASRRPAVLSRAA